MSTDPATPSESGAFNLDWRIAKAFAHFAGGFWTGPGASRAWTLTLSLIASLLLSTFITVVMNRWNGWFVGALLQRDIPGIKFAILTFFPIVAFMAAVGVAILVTRATLHVRWRQWLVEHLIGKWLERQKFYHLNATGLEPPNPEYRISDDTRWATEMLVDLGIGLVTAVCGGAAFIVILWTVGGSLQIGHVAIPGFMVWCALGYGITASALTAYIGRPLVGRVGQKNEAEGYFRFAMMRLRDNAESIALAKGAPAEQKILGGFYDTVVLRALNIVRANANLTWITNASGPMIPIVPLFFATPKYLAGDLSYDQMTVLVGAFIQVQQAISWVVDNYSRIADWYASARRVMDIVNAGDAIEAQLPAIRPEEQLQHGTALSLESVSLSDAAGRSLLLPVSLDLKRGEAVHITGASNTGKSTLARILAGLVVPTKGTLSGLPPQSILLLPQKGYLPLGTLCQIVTYPSHSDRGYSDIEVVAALGAVGLAELIFRLHERVRWDQILSASDRQRLAIARVLIAKPEVLVIDDALSALDAATQKDLILRLRTDIPGLTILNLAQRPPPPGCFDRTLELTRVEGAAMYADAI